MFEVVNNIKQSVSELDISDGLSFELDAVMTEIDRLIGDREFDDLNDDVVFLARFSDLLNEVLDIYSRPEIDNALAKKRYFDWLKANNYGKEDIENHLEDAQFEEGKIVCRYFELNDSDSATTLPDGIVIDSLQLRLNTSFTTWPADIKITSTLDINQSTSCQSLPAGLDLITLNIANSEVRSIPLDTKVSNRINARGTFIQSLPSGLNLVSLDVAFSHLDILPDDLVVMDSLDISNTKISSIPNDTQPSEFYANQTNMTSVPAHLSGAQKIIMAGSQVMTVPDGFECDHLDIANCPIETLPTTLNVRILNITGTNIKKLPPKLKLEKLYVRGTRIGRLPDDVQISETIYVDKDCSPALRKQIIELHQKGQIAHYYFL
ncbi:hypothetical protein COT97_00890 [Candidatus Falkowbacteria bacterium CG10_big_fil_rev_8_21_14_0_10_39_11]|uniref:Leucine-rich repeat domain-containing protein n=1 Tax=Candidatus Falkowbacteria bacterium CG10_big_fil_rev_8_21_14_0_10_39_11 TaxID=1974565 RepID=A0A2H0V5U5_9BACT|nr:MAG: hypothetical protein COT97_00890 [Candidatus Falkowbacteria bacterium CG10_big_fil_rev_8_21_14_0_10_39_11]